MAVTSITGHQSYRSSVPSTETDTIALGVSSLRPTVAVHPGAGGTMTIQYTASPLPSILAGTASWVNWAHNASSAPRLEFLQGPVTGIRCTAAVSEGVWEVVT